MNNAPAKITCTIHNHPSFSTHACVYYAGKRYIGDDVGFGFESAAKRSAVELLRGVAREDEIAAFEQQHGL